MCDIDWEAFLKSHQGQSSDSSTEESLLTICNENAGLAGLEHFSKKDKKKNSKSNKE